MPIITTGVAMGDVVTTEEVVGLLDEVLGVVNCACWIVLPAGAIGDGSNSPVRIGGVTTLGAGTTLVGAT